MAVTIGHASIDENGKAAGGKAGDSTKKEVCTIGWYNGSWHTVLRPKNSAIAEKSAKACEAACANDNIGYDQNQRNTLNTQAKAKGYDLARITTPCECDCSSLMHVCAIAGGAKLTYGSNGVTTSTMVNAFVNSGDYEKLTDSKYLTSDKYLKRGDVLVKKGHTVMSLTDGSSAESSSSTTKPSTTTTTTTTTKRTKATESPRSGPDKSMEGTYMVTASLLNVRNGAGTTPNSYGKDKTILVAIPKGTKVNHYGFYTTVSGTKWLYVQFTYKGTLYTGFASSKHLVKL